MTTGNTKWHFTPESGQDYELSIRQARRDWNNAVKTVAKHGYVIFCFHKDHGLVEEEVMTRKWPEEQMKHSNENTESRSCCCCCGEEPKHQTMVPPTQPPTLVFPPLLSPSVSLAPTKRHASRTQIRIAELLN